MTYLESQCTIRLGIRGKLFNRVEPAPVKGGATQYSTQSHEPSLQRTIAPESFYGILRTAGGISTGGSNVRGQDAFVDLDKTDEYMINKLYKPIFHNYRGSCENRG
jgi:hypothetical protein